MTNFFLAWNNAGYPEVEAGSIDHAVEYFQNLVDASADVWVRGGYVTPEDVFRCMNRTNA